MNEQNDKHSIEMTKSASEQIRLILSNDYTLPENSFFRVKIGGKGCDGFTYETGFSTLNSDDHFYIFNELKIIIDPFTAYYFKSGKIDFVNDIENNADGFVIVNHDESNFKGKFFKDESLVPKL